MPSARHLALPLVLAAFARPAAARAQGPADSDDTQATAAGQGPSAAEEGPSPEQGTACLRPPVTVARAHTHPLEEERLALTLCDGRPNLDALDALSVLARPSGVDRPAAVDEGSEGDGREVAPGILRLHPGLLTRLQSLADRFPGAAIEIVSGYRPRSRRTSRHHTGRALDVAFEGIDRHDVAEFARANLEATGVGYYPNSSFTHIDVRETCYAWVDTSGPGQRQRRHVWPDGVNGDVVAGIAPPATGPSETGDTHPVAVPPPLGVTAEPSEAATATVGSDGDHEPSPETPSAPAADEPAPAPRQVEDILARARAVASDLSRSMKRLQSPP